MGRLLAERPELANAAGGPNGWPPLMYLTYSRLPGLSESAVLATAALLLEAGASPNAGFLWQGLVPPFTALTGVFGEGESGPGREPRHPHATPLAELLLRAGADPNDGQALYNRMFRPDNSHLKVLFAHGLGTGDGGPWVRRLGAATESVADMMRGQLGWAASHGFVDRLELFAEHGWGLDTVLQDGRPVAQHLASWQARQHSRTAADINQLVNGRTALHDAAWAGDVPLINELLAAGADPTITDAEHHTRAIDWAEWAYQPEAVEVLRTVTPDA